MKITVKTKEFARACGSAKTFAPGKTSLPILGGLHFQVTDNSLTVSASDLDLWFSTQCSSEAVGEIFDFVLPATKMVEYLGKAAGPEVTLDLTRKESEDASKKKTVAIDVVLQCDKSRFSMTGWDGADFPAVPEVNDIEGFDYNSHRLANAIDATSFAAHRKDTVSKFSGLNFRLAPDYMRVQATDSYRLSKWLDVQAESTPDIFAETMLPFVAAEKLRKELPESAPVNLKISDSLFAATWDGGFFRSRILDGQFPSDKVVAGILQKGEFSWRINTERLKGALGRVMLAEAEEVTLCFNSSGQLKVQSFSVHGFSSEDEFPVQPNLFAQTENHQVRLVGKWLLEAIGAFHEQEIDLTLRKELGPVHLTAENSQLEHVVYPRGEK
jgi:DNA polymerase-3 subunit beta